MNLQLSWSVYFLLPGMACAVVLLGGCFDGEAKHRAESERIQAALRERLSEFAPQEVIERIDALGGDLFVYDSKSLKRPTDPFVYAHLRGDRLTEEEIALLKQITALRELSLSATASSEEALRGIGGLHELESLSIDAKLAEDGARHFKSLRNLQHLNLVGAGFTDQGLEHLSRISSLRSLRFVGAVASDGVSDRGIANLANLPLLETLEGLWSNKVTDAAIGSLASIQSLTSLGLKSTSIGDAGMKALRQSPSLEQIILEDSLITDEGLDELSQISTLERLTIRGSKITDAGLPHLQNAKSLKKLYLVETAITAEAIETLRNARPDLVVTTQGVCGVDP